MSTQQQIKKPSFQSPEEYPMRMNSQLAAEYLGFNDRQLTYLCDQHRIAYEKPNDRCRTFLKADLEAYLASVRVKAAV